MAETKTLHGAFEVLVTDGPTWASYKIAAGSEAAAHAMARELWSRRGERGEPYAAPAGMAAEDASHVGGHSVPADPVVEEAPAAEAAPEEAPAADPPAADASADAPKGRGGRGS